MREKVIDEVIELLRELMIYGEYEPYIDGDIAEEIIGKVEQLKDEDGD